MSTRRYALVGAGHRAHMYVDAITGRYADRAVLAAICEPNPVRARYHADRVVAAGFPAPALYGPDDLETLIRDEKIDRLQSKLGEVLMDNELLYAKIDRLEAGVPFAVRRSKR